MPDESSKAVTAQGDEKDTSGPDSSGLLLPHFFSHRHTINDIKPASLPGEAFSPGIFLHQGEDHQG